MDNDIQADCEGYHRRFPANANNMAGKKFNSIDEDQVDSGLGSLGYFSGNLSSLEDDFSPVEIKDELKEAHKQTEKGSFDIVNSFRGLDIKAPPSTDSSRCDSGIGDDRPSDPPSDSINIASHSKVQTDSTSTIWSAGHRFTPEQVVDIFRGDEDGDSHLHLSIIHGLPEVSMQVIGLAPGSDWLSATNLLQQTPLHLAVITRQLNIVRRLMCAGAQVDVQDQMGNTPLHNACRLGFEDVVRTLLTPVRYEETYQNSYEIPLQCIPQDLESKNYEGLTCLHLAAIAGHMDVMRLLLQAGANVNSAEGKGGRTVLHLAADWGHGDMMKFLLERRDIVIDAKTYAGLTPILLAYGRNHVQTVAELYNRGASYNELSLAEESDGDTSDEEMVDHASYNQQCTSKRGQSYQQINR